VTKRDTLLDRCLTKRLRRRLGAPNNMFRIKGLSFSPLLDRCLTGVAVAPAGTGPGGFGNAAHRETLDEQDGGIGKVGYEINFNRVFFQYQPPRPLHEIDAELAGVEQRILALLREVTE